MHLDPAIAADRPNKDFLHALCNWLMFSAKHNDIKVEWHMNICADYKQRQSMTPKAQWPPLIFTYAGQI